MRTVGMSQALQLAHEFQRLFQSLEIQNVQFSSEVTILKSKIYLTQESIEERLVGVATYS